VSRRRSEWCRRGLHRLEGENLAMSSTLNTRYCRACAYARKQERKGFDGSAPLPPRKVKKAVTLCERCGRTMKGKRHCLPCYLQVTGEAAAAKAAAVAARRSERNKARKHAAYAVQQATRQKLALVLSAAYRSESDRTRHHDPTDDLFYLSAACVDCGKPILAPPRCYGCATGRPRTAALLAPVVAVS
jgi:hypothetical protein